MGGIEKGIAEYVGVSPSQVSANLSMGSALLRRRLVSQVLIVAYTIRVKDQSAATDVVNAIPKDKDALKTALDETLKAAGSSIKVLEIQTLPKPSTGPSIISDATILKFSLHTFLLILVNLLA